MPSYSIKSRKNLATCHSDLQAVFNVVIDIFDHSITEGHRGKEKQNEYFSQGRSKLPWPKGKHNKIPSEAVDTVPWPVDYDDRERITLFAGVVIGVAHSMGIKIRWGGDWDRDTQVIDNVFDDLLHFELIKEA